MYRYNLLIGVLWSCWEDIFFHHNGDSGQLFPLAASFYFAKLTVSRL